MGTLLVYSCNMGLAALLLAGFSWLLALGLWGSDWEEDLGKVGLAAFVVGGSLLVLCGVLNIL